MTCMDLNQHMTQRNSRVCAAVRIKRWNSFSKNFGRSQVKPSLTQETNKGIQSQPRKERTGLEKIASFQRGESEKELSLEFPLEFQKFVPLLSTTQAQDKLYSLPELSKTMEWAE